MGRFQLGDEVHWDFLNGADLNSYSSAIQACWLAYGIVTKVYPHSDGSALGVVYQVKFPNGLCLPMKEIELSSIHAPERLNRCYLGGI
jgi:hypothetical protein